MKRLNAVLGVVALFLDLCLLTAKVAKVVQLSATNVTLGDNFNLFDNW